MDDERRVLASRRRCRERNRDALVVVGTRVGRLRRIKVGVVVKWRTRGGRDVEAVMQWYSPVRICRARFSTLFAGCFATFAGAKKQSDHRRELRPNVS